MLSRMGANVHHCQSWKDLTNEDIARFFAQKKRAVCHLNKGHKGDHQDKILNLAWPATWARGDFYEPKSGA